MCQPSFEFHHSYLLSVPARTMARHDLVFRNMRDYWICRRCVRLTSAVKSLTRTAHQGIGNTALSEHIAKFFISQLRVCCETVGRRVGVIVKTHCDIRQALPRFVVFHRRMGVQRFWEISHRGYSGTQAPSRMLIQLLYQRDFGFMIFVERHTHLLFVFCNYRRIFYPIAG